MSYFSIHIFPDHIHRVDDSSEHPTAPCISIRVDGGDNYIVFHVSKWPYCGDDGFRKEFAAIRTVRDGLTRLLDRVRKEHDKFLEARARRAGGGHE